MLIYCLAFFVTLYLINNASNLPKQTIPSIYILTLMAISQLKKINESCFPVSYNKSFYDDMAKKQDENLCKFAYWNGFAVGAICTRIEAIPDW